VAVYDVIAEVDVKTVEMLVVVVVVVKILETMEEMRLLIAPPNTGLRRLGPIIPSNDG
jgi:hypothetical protein